jgi:hypothetical protein
MNKLKGKGIISKARLVYVIKQTLCCLDQMTIIVFVGTEIVTKIKLFIALFLGTYLINTAHSERVGIL